MQRRDFLKISAITGATTALDSCGKPEVQLIRFVPEEDLMPGIASWKPSLCTLCPAGCGTLVRVVEGEAEVVRKGKQGLIKMGLAKKLEGNPRHPVNQGKLCPRGQAGLQLTYHPDRIKTPLKRTGPRGSGQFAPISWDEAIQELVAQLARLRANHQVSSLAVVTSPLSGQRRALQERFLETFGAPPPVLFEVFDESVLRHANHLSFGRPQLPTVDLARANYVISFGADFLGPWNSPVAQSRAYGEMRQGRPGTRAKLVQVESRMSLTGSSADEWVPARPGSEGILALGIAHVLIREDLRPPNAAGRAGEFIAGWNERLPEYAPREVEQRTGVRAEAVVRLARDMAAHPPAVAIIGDAALAHPNALSSALAVNALNALLESIGRPGGIFFTPGLPARETPEPEAPTGPTSGHAALHTLVEEILLSRPFAPQVVLVYDANPVFAAPPAWGVRAALEKVPFLASFGSFLDETNNLADLILPDHSPLESWLDDVPESGTFQAVASLAPPAMRPLHDTRAMPDVMLEVARRLGPDMAEALPWNTYEDMLKAAFLQLHEPKGSSAATSAEDFWKQVQEQGGWWSAGSGGPSLPRESAAVGPRHRAPHSASQRPRAPKLPPVTPFKVIELEVKGAGQDFPFYFYPYASQMFYDGSLAHLPWLQETPDPLSTAMWGSWLEINPQTAARRGIRQGDMVEVASPHGKLQAPALISPGIAPDAVAMPVGQGHENFTRYASARGANPLSILSPNLLVPETGSLAWAATRVKITRVGKDKLILFAGGLREKPFAQERR